MSMSGLSNIMPDLIYPKLNDAMILKHYEFKQTIWNW